MSGANGNAFYKALMDRADKVQALDFDGAHMRAHEIRRAAQNVSSAMTTLRAADDLIRNHPKRRVA